jgi:single-stranded DNA-binding protein
LRLRSPGRTTAATGKTKRNGTKFAFGNAFSKTAERLVKGSLVYVQGELVTREYDRTIKVPNGKKTIEHTIKQLVVELKADTIRILDRSKSNTNADETPADTEGPD